MGLISLVLLLALVGCAVWFITTVIPMDPVFKKGITVVVVIAVVLYLIRVLNIPDIPVGR